MKVIGITGGIASGKSLITKQLKDWGYFVIDTDKISHQLLTEQNVINSIIAVFGSDVFVNNVIDRKALGSIIFRNKDKQQMLNSIIHPLVIIRVNELITKANNDLVFVDVPLLFESGMDKDMDYVIVVTVTKETQLERLMKRDHINKEYALAKINMQMPLLEKEALADFIIDNNDSAETTLVRLENVIRRIKNEI